MDFDYFEDEKAFQRAVRAFIAEHATPGSVAAAGPRGALRRDTPGAPLNGRMENYYRYSVIDTVGAGTSEVQRNIIARRGLGLPVEN